VLRPDDPELAAKTAQNYALANDRVLWRGEAAVQDGAFQIELDTAMPAGAALLKCYAVGEDGEGRPADAAGAMRLP
jgi:hypothetical protein